MKLTKTKLIFLLLLAINLIPVFCLADTYKPMEGIPGIISPGQDVDFPTYLMAIYKFGLWAIGLSAMFMIMIGGYMYLTSAGNNAQTGKAKGIITDAIAGLILALISYVLLYTINPELVQFKSITALKTSGTATTSGTGGKDDNNTSGPSKYEGYNQACPDPLSKVPIDFSKTTYNISPDSKCNAYDPSFIAQGAGFNVESKTLKTIAQIESTCGTNMKSDAGCCGLMQLKPATASIVHGSKVTCEELINDDELSINIAAKYIHDNQSKHGGDIQKILAGYNSGYENGANSSGGLAPSNDCPSPALKFQCCYDPQKLDQTIEYVWKGVALNNKL